MSRETRPSRHAVETAACAVLAGGALDYTLRRSPRARRMRVVIDPRRGVVVTVPLGRGRSSEPRRAGGGVVDRAVERRTDRAVATFLGEREAWLRRHLERQAVARSAVVSRADLTTGSVLPFRGEPHRVRIEPAGSAASPVASGRRSTVTRDGVDEVDELVIRLASRDRREPAAVLRAWLVERARRAIDAEIARHAPALGVAPAAVSLRDPRTRWGSATRTGRLSFSWRLVLAPPEALETVVVHELAHLRVFGHGPAFWDVVASRRPDHRQWRRWLRLNSMELHAVLADDEAETT